MRLLIAFALLLSSLNLPVAYASKPSEGDGHAALALQIDQQSHGLLHLVSFKKTNGILEGNSYRMMYSATIELEADCAWGDGGGLVGWGGNFYADRLSQGGGMLTQMADINGHYAKGRRGQQATITGLLNFVESDNGWIIPSLGYTTIACADETPNIETAHAPVGTPEAPADGLALWEFVTSPNDASHVGPVVFTPRTDCPHFAAADVPPSVTSNSAWPILERAIAAMGGISAIPKPEATYELYQTSGYNFRTYTKYPGFYRQEQIPSAEHGTREITVVAYSGGRLVGSVGGKSADVSNYHDLIAQAELLERLDGLWGLLDGSLPFTQGDEVVDGSTKFSSILVHLGRDSDAKILFNVASGLLERIRYKRPAGDRMVPTEVVFSEFRKDTAGFPAPYHVTVYRDGKPEGAGFTFEADQMAIKTEQKT